MTTRIHITGKLHNGDVEALLQLLIEEYGIGGVLKRVAEAWKPISFWTPLERAQHDVTVAIPMWLLSIPPGDRIEFAEWLVAVAKETAKDPEQTAYSIG